MPNERKRTVAYGMKWITEACFRCHNTEPAKSDCSLCRGTGWVSKQVADIDNPTYLDEAQ